MKNIYTPKGSMCRVCVNNKLDCSKALNFKYMPVMSQYIENENHYKVVKCFMFNKQELSKGDNNE